MLERVSLRLETCGRRLLRGQLEKRMLNSAFWVHGASELDLNSAGLFGFGLSGGGNGSHDYEEENAEGGQGKDCLKSRGAVKDIARLEFLYPTKTLAFLRYLSTPPCRGDHQLLPPRNAFSHESKRLYTAERRETGPELRFPDAEAEPKIDERFANLQHLRGSGEKNLFDAAWYHYLNEKTGDEGKVSSRKERRNWMLSYFEYSGRRIDKERIVVMLQQVPVEDREPSDYQGLVHALLDLEMLEAAFSVLEVNVSRCQSSKLAGFERFIAHCIDYDLDMAVKAWEFLEKCPHGHPNELDSNMLASMVPGFKEKFMHMAETMERGGSIQRFVHELLRGALAVLTRPGLAQEQSSEYKPVWDLMRSLRMEKKGSDYEAVLFHLYRQHSFTEATEIYLEYRDFAGVKPNNDVLNAALRAFREQMDWRGMQMVFDDWFAFGSRPDQQAYYLIMREMARQGESRIVQELVDRYFERFQVETVHPFNHLMQAHSVRGELGEVVRVFNQIKEKGLSPDTVSHNILINAYAKAQDVDGALGRVQEMIGANLKPDTYTYTTLISMASERGDLENTQRMFEEAVEAGFEPNNMMYAALIAVHVSLDEIEAAESILEKAEDARVGKPNSAPTTQLWNNLLTGYAWRLQTNKLNEAYHRMRHLKVPFDEHTYGILMHSLCLVGKVEAAENILRVLKGEGFQLNEIHYSIIMVGYMKRKDLGKVWDTFREMGKQEIKPYSTSLAILIQASAFLEHSKWRLRGGTLLLESAEGILAEVTAKVEVLDLLSMDSVKAATPPWLFTPLISIYGKELFYQKAKDIFESFLNLSQAQRPGGTKPSLKMYIALMNAHVKANNIEGVRSTWNICKGIARKLAVPANEPSKRSTALWSRRYSLCVPFSIFIKAMSKADDIASIDLELEFLLRSGYEFDNNNWNDYVRAFTIGGELPRALLVCERKLMPGWPARKQYYYTQDSELRGPFPTFYPFIRTLETITTELRQLENAARDGNRVAAVTLNEYERIYPRTYEACENLINKEERIAKEVAYRVGMSVVRDGRLVPWAPTKGN